MSVLSVLNNLRCEHRLACELTTYEGLSLCCADAATHIRDMTLELQGVTRHNLTLPLHAIGLEEVCRVALGILNTAEHQDAAALCQRLDDEHTRHNRLLGEVTHKEWLVHRYLLDTADVVLVDVEHTINKQEWRAVREELLNLVDIQQRLLLSVILEHRTVTATTDLTAEVLHKLGISEVTRTCSPHSTLDAHAKKGEVAKEVEELVAWKLVVGT